MNEEGTTMIYPGDNYLQILLNWHKARDSTKVVHSGGQPYD